MLHRSAGNGNMPMRMVAFILWLAALGAAQPARADALLEFRDLEQRLTATAIENPGEYGIAALDLATGRVISVNGGEPFPMASTMKIAVAAAYLADVDAGRRSLVEPIAGIDLGEIGGGEDRKSTRLNSSHSQISYAVFCLKKKKK